MEQMLTDIDNLLSDFNHEISSYLSGEEFDDEVFYQTEKRLDEINHLKSKYGNTMEEILQSAEEKTKRIAVLQDYDKYLNDLLTSMNRKKEELDGLCAEVSGIRKKAAKGLTKAIAQALEDLNFLDVQFTMEFRKTEYSAGGWDEAEFMISTNPGEPLKPLGKVASGGELSRIALAVKTVMADTDEIPTLIFDEIDSGISGRTAQMVSQKMKLLAKTHQIICITHLPQIAAMADAHFLIEKSVEHASTVSRISAAWEEESIEERADAWRRGDHGYGFTKRTRDETSGRKIRIDKTKVRILKVSEKIGEPLACGLFICVYSKILSVFMFWRCAALPMPP